MVVPHYPEMKPVRNRKWCLPQSGEVSGFTPAVVACAPHMRSGLYATRLLCYCTAAYGLGHSRPVSPACNTCVSTTRRSRRRSNPLSTTHDNRNVSPWVNFLNASVISAVPASHFRGTDIVTEHALILCREPRS